MTILKMRNASALATRMPTMLSRRTQEKKARPLKQQLVDQRSAPRPRRALWTAHAVSTTRTRTTKMKSTTEKKKKQKKAIMAQHVSMRVPTHRSAAAPRRAAACGRGGRAQSKDATRGSETRRIAAGGLPTMTMMKTNAMPIMMMMWMTVLTMTGMPWAMTRIQSCRDTDRIAQRSGAAVAPQR